MIQDIINSPLLDNLLLFITSGVLGIIYAYSWKWVELTNGITYTKYMFGDKKEVIKIALVFISLCIGTLSLNYLEAMNAIQIIVAGASMGFLVPQKIKEKNG